MTKLYETIKMLCDEKKLSIRQLEKEAGLKPSTINDWKESSPSSDKLLSVAHVFDVSTDFLLDNTSNSLSHKNSYTVYTNSIIKVCEECTLDEKSAQIIRLVIKNVSEVLNQK